MATTETIKEKRKQAIKLVEEIQSIVKDLKDNQELFNTLSRQIKIKDKDYTSTLSKLTGLNESLKSLHQKILEDKATIQSHLNDAESFYQKKYLPLVEKINDPTNGLKQKLHSIETDEKNIKRISSICNQKFTEIKTTSTNFKNQVVHLNKLIKRIEGLEKRAEITHNKIDSIHKNVQDLERKSNLALKSVQHDQETSKKVLSQIENVKLDSDSSLSKIIETQAEADEKLASIQRIYEIAHETGLSGEFEKRRNQHNDARKKWGKYLFIASIVLLILLIAFYIFQLWLYDFDLESVTFDINFYIRYVILSPVVYYLFFCSAQHNKERRLFDKYSFKSTLALSIKSHIELLLDQSRFQSPENTDKIMNFVIDGFRNIYNEPYDIDDYRMKLKLSDIELNLEKRLIDKLGIDKIIPKK